LTKEGRVVNVTRPKHNFIERDARRILKTPWTQNDPIFIPYRYWLQFHYIFYQILKDWSAAKCIFYWGASLQGTLSQLAYDEDG